MSPEEHTEPEFSLECGCKGYSIGDAFVWEPCSPDCKYAKFVEEETARQGKTVEHIEGIEL